MQFKESETIELKESIADGIKKTLIAFANTSGGTLYIGVKDDGELTGIENAEEALLQVNNMMRDAIRPDLTMFARSTELIEDGKSILAIAVQRGTNRPYYLAEKGLRPAGVYVRQGAASVPATDTAIRQMIKETDGDSYEALRALQQELGFIATTQEFAKRGVEFGPAQMMTLGLCSYDHLYTNLGLLLSDQCPHTIKAAVFRDDTVREFLNRREFGGSLFAQINNAYDFIDMHNATHSSFDKLHRVDTRAFPEEAVREAFINAVAHREYAVADSMQVNIFPNRMEFISFGGLFRGVTLADILSGLSMCRNPRLANVLYRLRLIEAYGTGMRRIFGAYAGAETEPEVVLTPNVFKVVLPRIHNNQATTDAESPADTQSGEMQAILLAKKQGYLERKDLESLLCISQTAAGVLLKKLTERGLLAKRGNGKSTRYYPLQIP